MPTERVQRRIDRLLDQAEEAADRRDWTEAEQLAREVLGLDPENEDAPALIRSAQGMLEASPPDDQASATGDRPPAASSTELPTSFADGRYEVKRLLGEGGKKKVYLAHDTTLDRDVAFGLIKAEGLDVAARQRITREAQAMARLGDHPNLMPIFDLGDENGQPYMVQPLMAGGDVEALINDAEDGRLSLEEALRISSEILSGLEFAHAKGIIHRDLKPGNVWLTDPSTGSGQATVRIGDFGLALSLDRSRLTQEKMMVGTVSYMPPEQATGGEVTAQSDLYSLGAMLYEMVTGRPPFMGDDDIAIIGQHINTPPVAPSWHNQALPQTLDSLIMRLLAKDPAERPESATEVLQALLAIDPSEAATERDGEKGSLDAMAGGVFVGRHREMDQLKAGFEDTLGGHGKMVALVGEPGIGKTRIAQELATYASMRGGQVLWGRCYEGGGAPPYWPWVQAIRSYVMTQDAETVRREMGSTASVIAEIVPDVMERLPDVQAPPHIDDPESARFRLFDGITTFLKTAANTQPITLMLEDLHWADKPSLMLLEFLARELGNSRIMIVGNYRDMELNRRHPLSMTLGELTRERLFDRVLLRGLTREDVARFIEIAAGMAPPTGLIDAVYTQTEGNPLFITETVRLLIQEGDITSGTSTSGGTSSWEIRIPEGVREVIGRRLDRLSERCNEVLTIAAVNGRQFRFGVLLKLVDDVSENMLLDVLDVLDEALNARVIEEVPSEVGLYQFSHTLMQETLTSELSANRTVRMHARIAEALEEFYGDETEEHAAEMAEHFAEAEIVLGPEGVLKYALVAGNDAIARYSYDHALPQFERARSALEPGSDDLIAAGVLSGYARAKHAVGSRLDKWTVVDDMRQAMSIFERENELALAYSMVLGFDERAVAETGGIELIERALKLQPPSSLEAAMLWSKLGRFRGSELLDYASAEEAFKRASELAEPLGDRSVMARIAADRSRVIIFTAGADSIIAESEKALSLNYDPEDHKLTSQVAFNLSHSYVRIGKGPDAISIAERSLNSAQFIGDRNRIVGAWSVLTAAATATGDIERALEAAVQGLEIDRDDTRILGSACAAMYVAGEIENADQTVADYLNRLELDDQHNSTFEVFGFSTASTARWWVVGEALEPPEWVKSLYLSDGKWEPVKGGVPPHIGLPYAIGLFDRSNLEAYLEHFQNYGDPFGVQGFSTSNGIGRILHALGRSDEAIEAVSRAHQESRDVGFLTCQAIAAFDYANLLAERDAPADAEKAGELQDEAIDISRKIGMKSFLERVLASEVF